MSSDTRERPLAYSFKKSAELIGVSQSTLRRLAKISGPGGLQTVRVSRRRLVPHFALVELLRNGGPYQSASEKSQLKNNDRRDRQNPSGRTSWRI